MPLRLALVFHFNQHSSAFASIANRACYFGLLQVLRAHPRLKFNLHLSGTLLRVLPWFEPDSLPLVRAGLADGQFELLGSTHAQNVPYACHDWDNAQQIALHQRVLREMFDVEPATFWISERSWRQSLLPVIADGGYNVAMLEDHMLRAAGLVDPAPVEISHDGRALTVVYDDIVLRDRVNYAVWFGRRAQLFNYLRQTAQRPGAGQFMLAYAEDAEASGLWGYERGFLPHAAWAHLDSLLTELEAAPEFELVHLSAARPVGPLAPVPDSAAQWMTRALAVVDAPYHEDGYTDWFDFLQRSRKLAYFGRLHAVLRTRLQDLQALQAQAGSGAAGDSASARFLRQAIDAFCHHQYEFGCIGVGGRGYWGWENVRSAIMFARAAEVAADPRPRQWVEDISGDGSDEQILCDGRMLTVLTSYGGRLIYWFDLGSGRQWAGNQLAVPAAHYEPGTTRAPHPGPQPGRWLPDTYAAKLKPWQDHKHKEPAPTTLGRNLPDYIWQGEPRELTVYRNPAADPDALSVKLNAQTGLLADAISVDGAAPEPADELHDYRFEEGGLCYMLFPAPSVIVEKHIATTSDGLLARYVFDNRDRKAHQILFTSRHEMCPDYTAALGRGRAAFSCEVHGPRSVVVRNTISGAAMSLQSTTDWQAAECAPMLLALEVTVSYTLHVRPRSRAEIEIRLGWAN